VQVVVEALVGCEAIDQLFKIVKARAIKEINDGDVKLDSESEDYAVPQLEDTAEDDAVDPATDPVAAGASGEARKAVSKLGLKQVPCVVAQK
jgi:hypothetical protein